MVFRSYRHLYLPFFPLHPPPSSLLSLVFPPSSLHPPSSPLSPLPPSSSPPSPLPPPYSPPSSLLSPIPHSLFPPPPLALFQDIEFYNSLQYVRENDPEPLCLTFSTSREFLGELKEIPLKPGGENIDVTEQNKAEYIE